MRERVLITGANGFIGYHIVEEALKNNLDVYVALPKNSNIQHLQNLNIQIIHLKFNDPKSLSEAIRKNNYDYIIHAAEVAYTNSQFVYSHVNTIQTVNLAKAAVGQVKKFIFMSSLAAAGPLKTLNGIITEAKDARPVSNYGKSKLIAEQQLAKIPGLNYTILRAADVYGPYNKGLILTTIKKLMAGKEYYSGKEKQKLSFVYVKDLANAAVKAIYGGHFGTYNIADGNFYDQYEMTGIVKDILNLHTAKFHLPVSFVKIFAWIKEKVGYLNNKIPSLTTDRLKDYTAVNWACSIEQAKQELGFYPLYNLDSGMEETIKWYKANNWL